MSEIAQAYKLKESFIYVKIDRYYRYSKKTNDVFSKLIQEIY